MQKILVPIDFSEVTDAVLKTATRLAEAFQSEMLLLHIAPPEPDFIGYDPGPPSVRDQVAEQFREEHQRLQALKSTLSLPAEKVSALLVQGPIREKIIKEQERFEADLIVMGSHGHGAIYHLVAGSVTQGVLHDAKCPVLVVPANRKR